MPVQRAADAHGLIHIKTLVAALGDASDADQSIVHEQARYDLGELDWPIIDASGTPQRTLAAARANISVDLLSG